MTRGVDLILEVGEGAGLKLLSYPGKDYMVFVGEYILYLTH